MQWQQQQMGQAFGRVAAQPNRPNVDQCLAQCPLYRQRPYVRMHVMNLLQQTPNLRVTVADFVDNTGVTKRLLKIVGTIQIFYMGARYNTPVGIWIPENYPSVPPNMMVEPTRGMAIKPKHKHVGSDGKVYMPYLSQWSQSQAQGAMPDLVNSCALAQSIFSKEPPLYALPPQSQFVAQSTPAPAPAPAPAWGSAPAPAPAVSQWSVPQRSSQQIEQEKKEKLIKELTSRVRDKVQTTLEATRDGIDEEFETQHKLGVGKKQIQQGLAILQQQKVQLQQTMQIMTKKEGELTAWLANEQKNDGPLDADSLVQPADPLSAQAFKLVAEAAAIDDLIYHVEKALNAEVIDMKQALKTVRKYAQKQFEKKYHAQKVLAAQQ